jgi:predicted  nucleic acid-binding Zn-ribbon protein
VIKDEDEEIAEGQASISSASDKIHASFKTLSTSLLQLQAQTEQIETAMQAAKRPRLSIPSTVDQSMETTEEGQNPPKGPPFTQAG